MPIHLTKPDFPQQALVIEQIFQKKLLIVTDFDMRGLDDDGFHKFINAVKNTIELDSTIDMIVVDITGDPCRPDDPDVPHNPLKFQHHLSKIAPTVMVTEDYNYWYNQSNTVIFFPWQLWLYSTKSVGKLYQYQNTVYDTKIEKISSVVCLNRNLHWHRLYLFGLLAKRSWFDKINYSFIEPLGDRLDSPYGIKRHLNADEIQAIAVHGHLLPMRLKEETQLRSYKNHTAWFSGGASVDNPAHSNYAVNLITETSLTEGVVITEKTCKAIMSYQIPIIVGPVGVCQFLEDFGIDMFSDIIPWQSWDSQKDHKLRMLMIVDFLEQLLSKETAEQDILDLHTSLHARLIKNKQYFHSEEFVDKVTKQIKTYQYGTS